MGEVISMDERLGWTWVDAEDQLDDDGLLAGGVMWEKQTPEGVFVLPMIPASLASVEIIPPARGRGCGELIAATRCGRVAIIHRNPRGEMVLRAVLTNVLGALYCLGLEGSPWDMHLAQEQLRVDKQNAITGLTPQKVGPGSCSTAGAQECPTHQRRTHCEV